MPVVDRLEDNYGDKVDFRRIDANGIEGKQAFRTYQLLGHPGYVILNPRSDVLWKGQGEQTFAELESQLKAVLKTE